MTAIFMREGNLFRATEQAGGPWSPDMLQGSATGGLMVREVERLAITSGFAVRRLTFDLWRPAGLRAFRTETDVLRDGRKAKTIRSRKGTSSRSASFNTMSRDGAARPVSTKLK
jgi:hypothetical protein